MPGPTMPCGPSGRRSPNLRPEYDGPFYSYSDVVVDPCARQERVPFWIGGRTRRSLRRAVELGDGWLPFGLGADDMGAFITKASETPAWAERTQPLDMVLTNNRPADPMVDPDGARHIIRRLVEAGATTIQLRLIHHSRDHYIEQLEAMVTTLADK